MHDIYCRTSFLIKKMATFDWPFHNLMENADHWNHVCVLNYRTSQYIQRYRILLQF